MLTDRELSALVAEKVMGWTFVPEGQDEHYWWPAGWKQGKTFLHNPPAFATDQGLALDAALKVAWNVEIQAPDSDPDCRVKLLLRRPSQPEVAFGTTVARALCFAALLASGVEVEDDGGGE